jgi:hypothetical protein
MKESSTVVTLRPALKTYLEVDLQMLSIIVE